jgi:hypothetical protein
MVDVHDHLVRALVTLHGERPHAVQASTGAGQLRQLSTPYLEILVRFEYNVAGTVARKGGGKPAGRRSDCPGVSTCLRG